MDIQIIVDSCCDLTPALRNLLRVSVASLKIDVGSIHYVDDERIDTKKLIADMKAYKNAPSTACPSPDEYAALMEKSEESFVVTLSGKLSGSYNAACVGREMVLERSPEKKIHIFDSESASAGETLIALMLRDPHRRRAFLRGHRRRDDSVHCADENALRAGGPFQPCEKRPHLQGGGPFERHAFAAAHHGRRRPRQHRGHRKGARAPRTPCAVWWSSSPKGTREAAASSLTMVLSYCNCPERALMLKKEFLEKCAALREVILVPTSGLSTVYAYDGGIVLAY